MLWWWVMLVGILGYTILLCFFLIKKKGEGVGRLAKKKKKKVKTVARKVNKDWEVLKRAFREAGKRGGEKGEDIQRQAKPRRHRRPNHYSQR